MVTSDLFMPEFLSDTMDKTVKEVLYMIFSEKLQLMRKSKGLTQEELAEKLCVSRQAVAKWESGQSYPDIGNLIMISELFKVTVDYLVKDHDECKITPAGQEAVENKKLRGFLLEAKRNTYAGKGRKSDPSRPNSHDYRYEIGDLLYIDTYIGGESFSGEEAVWVKNNPVYAMNYFGRVLAENFSGDFLKAALREVRAEKPYRGPVFYQEGEFVYSCKVSGNLDWYQGYEEIYDRNQKLYECYFHGGVVR